MNRRSAIVLGLAAAGGYGVAKLPENSAPDISKFSDVDAGLTTNRTELKSNHPDDNLIEQIQFFDNGTCDVHLSEDHNHDRIAIFHSNRFSATSRPADAYGVWNLPDFGGPATIPVRNAINGQGPYPSRIFTLALYGGKGERRFDARGGDTDIRVPSDWIELR